MKTWGFLEVSEQTSWDLPSVPVRMTGDQKIEPGKVVRTKKSLKYPLVPPLGILWLLCRDGHKSLCSLRIPPVLKDIDLIFSCLPHSPGIKLEAFCPFSGLTVV